MTPAMVLQRIEERLNQPIADVFDYIAGTSTGGVISLLLAKPQTGSKTEPMYFAKDIVELYTDHGRDMFRRSRGYQVQTLNGWLRNKYPEQSVLSTLQGYLDRGERSTMKEALTRVFLTSYDIERRRLKARRSTGSFVSPADCCPATSTSVWTECTWFMSRRIFQRTNWRWRCSSVCAGPTLRGVCCAALREG